MTIDKDATSAYIAAHANAWESGAGRATAKDAGFAAEAEIYRRAVSALAEKGKAGASLASAKATSRLSLCNTR